MDSLVQWLEGLGLGQYAAVFAANDIDWNVLHELTEDDLEKLGLSLGHRKRLLKAISAQRADQPKAGPQPVFPALPQTAGHRMTEPERRQLTVMFCDLVGSTALSTSLDLEDFREVISVYYRCVAETMESWDGFVANYMGDGVLVYFGYPEAHEDDVERAVSAGLALVEAVSHLQVPSPLEVRIGIATGMVVVGDHVGTGDAQGHGVVGEALNLAARLQALAEPGTVVVGPTTRRLLGDLFEYQELGAFELKGVFRTGDSLPRDWLEHPREALRGAPQDWPLTIDWTRCRDADSPASMGTSQGRRRACGAALRGAWHRQVANRPGS
jgi:class 3 adenylate cyclase